MSVLAAIILGVFGFFVYKWKVAAAAAAGGAHQPLATDSA